MEFALDKELGDGVELEHEPAQQHARRTGGEVVCAFLTHANAIRLTRGVAVRLPSGKCKHSTSCRRPGKSFERLFPSYPEHIAGEVRACWLLKNPLKEPDQGTHYTVSTVICYLQYYCTGQKKANNSHTALLPSLLRLQHLRQ